MARSHHSATRSPHEEEVMPGFRTTTDGRPRAPRHVHTVPAITAAFLAVVGAIPAAFAATPPSGTLSNASPMVAWTGSVTGFVTGVGEIGCVDGVSCDSFQVILAPGDYTGKQVKVQITWTVPAYDYDLYVHRGTLRGPVFPAANGGPPTTEEHVLLNLDSGIVTTPVVWWAHIQAATVPPGQVYNGSASIVDLPNAPTVSHLPGSLPSSRTV